MKSDEDLCKGCNTIIYDGCGLRVKFGDKICPCAECIVKVMCDDACDEFNTFKMEEDKERILK